MNKWPTENDVQFSKYKLTSIYNLYMKPEMDILNLYSMHNNSMKNLQSESK